MGGMPRRDHDRDRSERGFRLLPHTADVIVSAWAPTAPECVAQAVRGLVAIFAEVTGGAPTRPVPFACGPDSDGELLVRVLEEVIYLVDARDLVAVRALLRRSPQGGLAGHFDAVPLAAADVVGPAPKAIARHGLSFAADGGRWRCTVTVDV